MVPDLPLPRTDRPERPRVREFATRYAARYGLFAYALALAATALVGAPALVVYGGLDPATAAQVTLAAVAVGYLTCVGLLFRDRVPV